MATSGDYESTNINSKWLENIYEQLQTIQNMERLAREGCNSIMEYMQIQPQTRQMILADVEYKNLRFMALEMDILIGNLAPVLEDKTEKYNLKLNHLLQNIDTRHLFLKEIKKDNQVVHVEALQFMYDSIGYLSNIKTSLIKDIGHLLYIKEQDNNKKKW
jgi:hypothetical protein